MVKIEDTLNNYCSSWEKICGSICLMSCAHDMAKWMKFHLSGGLNESGNRIMLSETLKSTYKARNSITSLGISKINTFQSRRFPTQRVKTTTPWDGEMVIIEVHI